jgi:hypothetical protein
MNTLFALGCVALFFAGHVIRDGWPSFKEMLAGLVGTKMEWLYHLSTQLARLTGAAVCGVGAALVVGPLFGLIVGAAILVGFYVDMKHGEAAGVDTKTAVFDAFLSGVTSLVPLGVAFTLDGSLLGFVVLVGLLKPAVWKLAWMLCPNRQDTWFQPTRIAAGVFGALIGAAIIVVRSF